MEYMYFTSKKNEYLGGVRSRMLESECLSLPISYVEILISRVRAEGDGL